MVHPFFEHALVSLHLAEPDPIEIDRPRGVQGHEVLFVFHELRIDRGEIDLATGQLAIEHYWAGALRRAVVDGDIENGSLMAGQSVGMVTAELSVAAIIAELVAEAEAALVRRSLPYESAA